MSLPARLPVPGDRYTWQTEEIVVLHVSPDRIVYRYNGWPSASCSPQEFQSRIAEIAWGRKAEGRA